MGTLASELGPFAEGFTQAPRIYVDANLPAGLVRFMRERLHWDVLFVIEEDSLRRARDIEHFRLAMQLRRTLVTLDQDFLDDDRFPPAVCGGIIVLSAPHEAQFQRLLQQVDRVLFPKPSDTDDRTNAGGDPVALPLTGRKLHVHTDWNGDLGP
jgi:Domain of unknown function (DUF5615)